MNNFYKQNIVLQWIVASLMFLLMIGFMILWFLLVEASFIYVISIFIIIPISQLLVSPLYTLMDLYKYLSPMLLVVNASDKKYDLHNGTTFDYLYTMRNVKPGAQWKKTMLVYYLDGLLEIIRRVEENEIPETLEVRGSSYFFSERTAQNLGFEIKKSGSFEKLNLLINYIDLLGTYSLANAKLSFPNLMKIKTASTSGKILTQNKLKLIKYREMVAHKQNP